MRGEEAGTDVVRREGCGAHTGLGAGAEAVARQGVHGHRTVWLNIYVWSSRMQAHVS